MGTNHFKLFAALIAAAALGGCAGGASHYAGEDYAQPGPLRQMSSQAFADQVYLDGTGASARRASASGAAPARRIVAEPNTSGVTRPVVTARPLAIERDRAPHEVTASTTGARSSVSDANKPFTDQWWEKERREDARLKSRMNICRGC